MQLITSNLSVKTIQSNILFGTCDLKIDSLPCKAIFTYNVHRAVVMDIRTSGDSIENRSMMQKLSSRQLELILSCVEEYITAQFSCNRSSQIDTLSL